MALTYTWSLKTLKKTNTSEFEDVVVQTTWECTGTDEDGYSGTFHGATPFKAEDVDGDGFITYADLTEEIVLGWVQGVVVGSYKDHIDEQIMKQINQAKNPVVEVNNADLPWASNTAPTPTPTANT